jgi:hypothetical protein
LLCAIRQPEFKLATYILGQELSLSLPLSKFLQTKNIDLVEAIQIADDEVNIFKQLNLNNKSEFKIIFNNVKSKCEAIIIEPSIPRTTNKQNKQMKYPG